MNPSMSPTSAPTKRREATVNMPATNVPSTMPVMDTTTLFFEPQPNDKIISFEMNKSAFILIGGILVLICIFCAFLFCYYRRHKLNQLKKEIELMQNTINKISKINSNQANENDDELKKWLHALN